MTNYSFTTKGLFSNRSRDLRQDCAIIFRLTRKQILTEGAHGFRGFKRGFMVGFFFGGGNEMVVFIFLSNFADLFFG